MLEWDTPDYEARMQAEYERIRQKHSGLVTKRFECFAGWYGIIEAYFDDVAHLLSEHPGSTYELLQVKEKFAGLRLYSWPSHDIQDAVHDAYDRASALSQRTCEVCGAPGILRRRGGWYATRCDEHVDDAEPVAGIAGGEA